MLYTDSDSQHFHFILQNETADLKNIARQKKNMYSISGAIRPIFFLLNCDPTEMGSPTPPPRVLRQVPGRRYTRKRKGTEKKKKMVLSSYRVCARFSYMAPERGISKTRLCQIGKLSNYPSLFTSRQPLFDWFMRAVLGDRYGLERL